MWQNFDSDETGVQIIFFKGEKYDFFGLVNGEDSSRVFSGLNTAGFGIVLNYVENIADDSTTRPYAILVKNALSRCSHIEDFDPMWRDAQSNESNAAIACIDAYGGAVLYDTAGRYAADDPSASPEGFLVRANFSFRSGQQRDAGFWRYHRSRKLIRQKYRSINVKTTIQKISRDVQSMEMDPSSLPARDETAAFPAGYIRCEHTINQYNTVAGIVIHGVRVQENPDFATLWATLGQPLCGVAVPMWPATGESPYECHGKKAPLNALIQANKRVIYNRKESRTLADINLLVNKNRGLLPMLARVEKKIFYDTQKALDQWRKQNDYLEEMIDFQNRTATWVLGSIKY